MQFTSLGTIAFADVPKEKMADANSLFNILSQVTMAAGIMLGAIGIRLGDILSVVLQLDTPGTEYRLAFLLVTTVALVGLIDTIRLPKGAGDHFISRT